MDPTERGVKVAGILVLFQIVPLSPGSFCRGLYTTILAIKERNFKDYNIALFLSYFKYVGYLAFPIQMTYHYPTIARFMAGHWATDAVHIIPVFGERGAVLEHWIFCLFYNWPLTIRRRIRKRLEKRASLKPRYLHMPIIAALGAAAFVYADKIFLYGLHHHPSPKDIWYLTLFVPLLAGVLVTLGAGGLAMWKRFASATFCGLAIGAASMLITYRIMPAEVTIPAKEIIIAGVWRVFALAIFATVGAILTEINLPDPDLYRKNKGDMR